jgi:PIN domain nuclease of toxin-antitoxin system
MRLLIDTQIVLWTLDRSLTSRHPKLYAILSDSGSGIFVSVATLWEIAIKTRLRKLENDWQLDELPLLLKAQAIAILPIEVTHALSDIIPDIPTRDPFDRLLLAQAQIEGMRFVTVDKALADHPVTFR